MSDDERSDTTGKDDEIPRQSLFQLLPRRSLAKIAMLLAMLVAIVVLQRRAGLVANCAQQTFIAPAPRSAPPVRVQQPPADAR